jgi:hypothetical protein
MSPARRFGSSCFVLLEVCNDQHRREDEINAGYAR